MSKELHIGINYLYLGRPVLVIAHHPGTDLVTVVRYSDENIPRQFQVHIDSLKPIEQG